MKWLLTLAVGVSLFASWGRAAEVVIYTSIDEPYFAPLFKRFEKESGITVRYVTDAEASKTTGLAEKLLAEKANPKADVYWGNEVFHTVNLARQGCFAPYAPPAAKNVPAQFKDAGQLWTGIGVRTRMIVTGEGATKVTSLSDLTSPALKGKISMANPAFGTTSGHMAALYLKLGKEPFTAWVRGLKANDVKLLGGNSAVVTQVAAGNFAAGLTDNDDISAGQAEGAKVAGVTPTETLLIPTTIALVKGAPHESEAKKLIDFLTDPSVETELLRAKFLAYSVRKLEGVKSLEVDFEACAKVMKEAVETTLKILQDR